MSGHCPKCGAYCEEDDRRACAACAAVVIRTPGVKQNELTTCCGCGRGVLNSGQIATAIAAIIGSDFSLRPGAVASTFIRRYTEPGQIHLRTCGNGWKSRIRRRKAECTKRGRRYRSGRKS